MPSDNFSIAHRTGHHRFDYLHCFDRKNKDFSNRQTLPLFDIKVKPNIRSFKKLLWLRLLDIMNLFVTEWEFELKK